MSDPREDSQELAARLRDLRTQAGLSTYQLSQMLGWSQTKVSKVERGQSVADPEDVAAWAAASGAAATYADELVGLAETIADQMKTWRTVHGQGLTATQRQLAAIHSAMTGYREFCPYAIPGFLQTETYALAVLELADVSGRKDVQAAAGERMRRQAILLDPARSFRFILSDAALRIRFGDAATMSAQAEKILASMALPNVSVLILPFTAQSVALQYSGFAIFDRPGEPMVMVELLSRELHLRSAWDVRVYEEAFERLRAAAVTGESAISLIRAAMAG